MDRLNSNEEDETESEFEDERVEDGNQFDEDFDDDEDTFLNVKDLYNGPDVEGLPRGEQWLMSQFLASNELADEQN